MLLYLLGPVLAILVIALGTAFGILLAKRLESSSPQARFLIFWKPIRLVLLGFGAFALVAWICVRLLPY